MTENKESDKLVEMESDYCLAMTQLIFPEAKTCAEGSKLMAKKYGVGLKGAIEGKNANLVNEPSSQKENPEATKPVILTPKEIKANAEKGIREFLGIEEGEKKPEPKVGAKPKVKAEAKPKTEAKAEA